VPQQSACDLATTCGRRVKAHDRRENKEIDVEFDWLDTILRLGAATLAGIIIGINRDLADKPIGMRTLGLVALGAAVVSMAAIQYHNLADQPDALSRVVQGIIQGIMGGISFIGAGVILRDPKARTVEGLTTAATVWVTAAFGIACALAAWHIVAVATVLALLLLFAGAWTERLFARRRNGQHDPESTSRKAPP
jgi:putative Mg2+ transporter-C (MgtC) family protein